MQDYVQEFNIQQSQDYWEESKRESFDEHVKLEVKLIQFIHEGQKDAQAIFNNLKQIKLDEKMIMIIIKFRLGLAKEMIFKTHNDHNDEQLKIFHALCERLQQYIFSKSNKFEIIQEFLSKIQIDYKIHTLELIRQVTDGLLLFIPITKQFIKQLNEYEQSQQNDHEYSIIKKCYNLFIFGTKQDSYKVLLLGRTGTGKSTLGNDLIKKLSQNKIQGHFNNSDSYFGGTKSFEVTQIKIDKILIDIIDAPGFGDVEVDIYEMIKNLYSQGTINLIIYCFNATVLRQHRLDSLILAFIQGLYQQKWDNFYVCLNFTDYLKPADLQDSKRFDQIIKLLNQSFDINIPAENLIKTDKLDKILSIILSKFMENGYNDGFIRLKYPSFSRIKKKAAEFMC